MAAPASPRLCENKEQPEKGNVCVLKVVLEYFYPRCVSSKRQKWNSRRSNQKWRKRPLHAIKSVFTKAATKWRAFFSVSDGLIFLFSFFFFTMLHICVASKQRAALLWIMKGLYSSLASLLQSAKQTTTSTAHRHVYGWDVAPGVPQGQVATGPCEIKNPPPSAPLTFPTPAREREHLVFTSRLVQDLKLS